MSKPETLETVTAIYRKGEKVNNCTDLKKVAEQISKEFRYDDPNSIVYDARRISRPDHLFPGALTAVQSLMDRRDEVVVWTQGHPLNQLYKVAGSGISSVRRDLPPEERARFSVRAEMDKVTDIDKPIMDLRAKGVEKVVIVDDKSDNVKKVKERIDKLKQAGKIDPKLDISVVWARYGVYKDKAPKGLTLDDFLQEVETLEDVSELSKYGSPQGTTGWLLDFDNTLFRTADYNTEMYAHTAHQIDGIDQILPTRIGLATGLTGNIERASLMKHGGMSGSHLSYVKTNDGKAVVVKHHQSDPSRVRNDIAGYSFLTGTPIETRMPQIEAADPSQGYLVLPHIEGPTLREHILKGSLGSSEAIQIYQQLLDLKRSWWGSQDKMSPEQYKSMQRAEWDETQKLIPESIVKMASYFGVSKDSFWSMPIRIDGRKLPSLESVVNSVAKLLEQPPKYVIGVHGDATGSNIIVGSNPLAWMLIDAEWADFGDPAESYLRMAKQLSTTTAIGINVKGVGNFEEGLGVMMDSKFNQVAHALNDYILNRASEFALVLKDPDFINRLNIYSAGSYLRELALINKRGNIQDGLLAMVMAGKALSGQAVSKLAA